MSDNSRVSETTLHTSSQMVTATTEDHIKRAAHDAVLATYSEEARKAYPEGWNEEELSDFHADSMTKERQSESLRGETAIAELNCRQEARPNPTAVEVDGELAQFATPAPNTSESTGLFGRDSRDEGAGQQTQFV